MRRSDFSSSADSRSPATPSMRVVKASNRSTHHLPPTRLAGSKPRRTRYTSIRSSSSSRGQRAPSTRGASLSVASGVRSCARKKRLSAHTTREANDVRAAPPDSSPIFSSTKWITSTASSIPIKLRRYTTTRKKSRRGYSDPRPVPLAESRKGLLETYRKRAEEVAAQRVDHAAVRGVRDAEVRTFRNQELRIRALKREGCE